MYVFFCTFTLLLSFVGRNNVVTLQPLRSFPNPIVLPHVSRFVYQSIRTTYQISSRADVHDSAPSFIDHPCAIKLCKSRITINSVAIYSKCCW
jgi:hypothetical protein